MPCKWDEFLPGSTQQQVCFNMEVLAINLGKYVGRCLLLSKSMIKLHYGCTHCVIPLHVYIMSCQLLSNLDRAASIFSIYE